MVQRPNPTPTKIECVTNRLDKYYTILKLDALKQLPENWNGYGAQQIDVKTIESAKQLIVGLSNELLGTISVVPMTRGRLQLEWHRGNRSLELEFENPRLLHYLKADDDLGIEEEDVLFAWDTTRISDLLDWFSAE